MPVWKCSAPEYIRAIENGNQTFMYRFRVVEQPHDILTVAKGLDQDSLRRALVEYSLIDDEYKSYLIDFFSYIVEAYGRYFNKKYTAQQYASSAIHQFINIPITEDGTAEEQTCLLNPVELLVKNGRLIVRWSVEVANMIDFQLEDDSVVESPAASADAVAGTSSVSAPSASYTLAATTVATDPKNVAASGAQSVNSSVETDTLIELEDVDSSPESNEIMPIRSGHHSISDKQIRDRQRVEEARLRAKLATVRAERALERYIEKYGTYETDDSSYDGETTDDDSE